jgi:hypothetical protein
MGPRIVGDAAVADLDDTIGASREPRIVRDNHDGPALLPQLGEELHDVGSRLTNILRRYSSAQATPMPMVADRSILQATVHDETT